MEVDDNDIPETGAVFTFGKSRFGDNRTNKFWIRSDKVTDIACGDEHTVVVTENGRLFTFGNNEWGQLGIGSNKTRNKPTTVKALKPEKITHVAAGRFHTLAVTDSNKLYSFGQGSEGALGHGDETDLNMPTSIESLEDKDVNIIACGGYHSAAITKNGELYIWGSNSEGQLGLKNDTISYPTMLDLGKSVISVACGYYHTAVVTADGKLYTFGETEGGKLGLGDIEAHKVTKPKVVKGISGKVVKVACGGNHTVALTASGQVYTFGSGQNGQLGLGSKIMDSNIPKLVEALSKRKIKHIACGESHTAVVSDKGELFTFGDGRHGKLGQGDESFSNLFKPVKVQRLKEFIVLHIACGGCHTIVACNKIDKLANGDDDNESSSNDEVDFGKTKLMLSSDELNRTDDIPLSARDRHRKKDNSPLNKTLPQIGKRQLAPLRGKGLQNEEDGLFSAQKRLGKLKLQDSDSEEDDYRNKKASKKHISKSRKDEDNESEDEEESRFSRKKDKKMLASKDFKRSKQLRKEESSDEEEEEDQSEDERSNRKRIQSKKVNKRASRKRKDEDDEDNDDEEDSEDEDEKPKNSKKVVKKKELRDDSEEESESDIRAKKKKPEKKARVMPSDSEEELTSNRKKKNRKQRSRSDDDEDEDDYKKRSEEENVNATESDSEPSRKKGQGKKGKKSTSRNSEEDSKSKRKKGKKKRRDTTDDDEDDEVNKSQQNENAEQAPPQPVQPAPAPAKKGFFSFLKRRNAADAHKTTAPITAKEIEDQSTEAQAQPSAEAMPQQPTQAKSGVCTLL
ncbi:uncharacterized protein TRIADDRAFT_56257 [Trichoplax adhaerens]|uniref:X-linked retinitis pigmentosa GTPase regulator n=1 Tax=Trichoplax adhaerens TaxID=10228 RepID=B3RXM0_TRIAD|nr:hypothetical protein TRIADDRAFT_56257 [Trichoplax adhaerens]EDV24451.1 hypothetical protein TRIADDRAFT_56257 [Trichoplax adhaerens]|eukprot:XP_002112341.1 hypothetical protein TRIADDRAFT_56257 [Trichoplax adhaerens]